MRSGRGAAAPRSHPAAPAGAAPGAAPPLTCSRPGVGAPAAPAAPLRAPADPGSAAGPSAPAAPRPARGGSAGRGQRGQRCPPGSALPCPPCLLCPSPASQAWHRCCPRGPAGAAPPGFVPGSGASPPVGAWERVSKSRGSQGHVLGAVQQAAWVQGPWLPPGHGGTCSVPRGSQQDRCPRASGPCPSSQDLGPSCPAPAADAGSPHFDSSGGAKGSASPDVSRATIGGRMGQGGDSVMVTL